MQKCPVKYANGVDFSKTINGDKTTAGFAQRSSGPGGRSLGLPKPKTCENRYSFCNHWAKKGYCENKFNKWMNVNCPVVCGKCTPDELEIQLKSALEKNSEKVCQDRYPISCPKWEGQNKCEHKDKFLRDYIRKNCELSCGVCSN